MSVICNTESSKTLCSCCGRVLEPNTRDSDCQSRASGSRHHSDRNSRNTSCTSSTDQHGTCIVSPRSTPSMPVLALLYNNRQRCNSVKVNKKKPFLNSNLVLTAGGRCVVPANMYGSCTSMYRRVTWCTSRAITKHRKRSKQTQNTPTC